MEKTSYVDHTKNAPTVLSFCSGYGGIERGLDIAGFKHRVITYVEIEAYAIANLVAKMESNQLDAATIYSDIKTFPSHIFRDKVSVITGGYPCQPFSLATGGKRRGNKDPRHLWEYIREHIKTIRPIWCFFENVEGHITLGLRDVIEDLESMGYARTFGIFSASEVGAPHQRKRVFILAHNDCQIRGRTSSEQQVKIKVKKTTRRTPIGDGCDDAKLADSSSARAEIGIPESKQWEEGDSEKFNYNSDRKWPSRPGESQHDWEEPRVILGDTESEQRRAARLYVREEKEDSQFRVKRKNEFGVTSDKKNKHSKKIEPKLGGATNGASSRVDRLRLLGNGVVPQTVEVAFRTLSKRIEERIKLI